ncbi:MAG: hypothetical protein AAB656_03565 [Patescibacteria group bacterium]
MAKSILKNKARELRERGESVKGIAKKLRISKSTVSLWVRDIILSVEQLEKLRQHRIKGGELGRLKGALMQKQRRIEKIASGKKHAFKIISSLSERELLVGGIALYWAEGSKKSTEVSFCNSDPKLIIFLIKWLDHIFGVGKERLTFRLGINKIHKKREQIVKNYWVDILNVSLDQFRKTSFKNSKSKKVYKNFNDHYGTLTVKVLKASDVYYRIMGFINALSLAG